MAIKKTSCAGQMLINFERSPMQLMSSDEIYNSCDENMLRALFKVEDCRLEKKPSGIHARQLSQYFSMWANTPPMGGVIVIGIDNDKTFEGCVKLHPNQINDLEKTPDTFCPDAQYKIKRIPIRRDSDKQNDFVILFWVEYHKTKVVRTTDGHVFVRRGDSKMELKGDAIRHLQAEKGEVRFETEPCTLSYPQDFDMNAVDEFVEMVRSKKGWDIRHSKEKILQLMHLGTFEGEVFIPNIALALLFAKDPRNVAPGCRIRFLRFSGETERTGEAWNAVKDEFIDGAIPVQIQKADVVLKSQLRNFSRLGVGGKFFTSLEYPEFAWYEAIVNACVHRSYGNGMKNMTIFVKMFDDKLVIESPGPFPPFVTPSNIYTTHHPRNPFLMDAMYYLKFVKCANEGTRRIKEEMLGMELPEPEFKQDDKDSAVVRVTLRNNIKQRKVWIDADVAEVLGAQIANSLSEKEKRCINFIAENGQISVSDVQRLTHMSWPASRKILGKLVEQGILEHKHRNDVSRDPKARFKLRGYSR
jgi:ATP-dependent DNA helicase RecG